MKNLLALFFSLFSSACFASTCLLESQSSSSSPDDFGRVSVECNVGNPDARSVKTSANVPTNREIATVLNAMFEKGYKVVSQSEYQGFPTYTLTK